MNGSPFYWLLGLGLAFALAPSEAPPTFSKDIAPILHKRCVSCHSDAKIAPFSLVNYQQAKQYAPNIQAVTHSGIMPPWKAKKGYGEFKNDPSLTDLEKTLIAKWVAAGAPEGNPAEAPPAPETFPDWRMGKPDLIAMPALPTKIKAEGRDFFRDYLVDPKITKPTWVRIVDFRPREQGTVHHIIPSLVTKEETEKLRKIKFDYENQSWNPESISDIDTYSTLGFWSTGAPPIVTPDQAAFLMNPGDTILIDVHYKTKGRPVEEQVQVALYFQDEPPKKEMSTRVFATGDIYIQPNEKNVRAYAIGEKIKHETTIYALWPHMHYLGRTFKAWVKYPSGYSKPLICIDDWDPEWQLLYYLKTPMVLPPGSQVYVTGTYDNTPNNPRNPHSPPKVVEGGESASDEMLLLQVFQVVKKAKVKDPKKGG